MNIIDNWFDETKKPMLLKDCFKQQLTKYNSVFYYKTDDGVIITERENNIFFNFPRHVNLRYVFMAGRDSPDVIKLPVGVENVVLFNTCPVNFPNTIVNCYINLFYPFYIMDFDMKYFNELWIETHINNVVVDELHTYLNYASVLVLNHYSDEVEITDLRKLTTNVVYINSGLNMFNLNPAWKILGIVALKFDNLNVYYPQLNLVECSGNVEISAKVIILSQKQITGYKNFLWDLSMDIYNYIYPVCIMRKCKDIQYKNCRQYTLFVEDYSEYTLVMDGVYIIAGVPLNLNVTNKSHVWIHGIENVECDKKLSSTDQHTEIELYEDKIYKFTRYNIIYVNDNTSTARHNNYIDI